MIAYRSCFLHFVREIHVFPPTLVHILFARLEQQVSEDEQMSQNSQCHPEVTFSIYRREDPFQFYCPVVAIEKDIFSTFQYPKVPCAFHDPTKVKSMNNQVFPNDFMSLFLPKVGSTDRGIDFLSPTCKGYWPMSGCFAIRRYP